MATKFQAALYAGDQDEQRLVDEIKDSYAKLRGSLESRNQLFDPVLLAMAQGFLAPTKTGSFGESLSQVAKNVIPVQEAEEKRSRDLAAMRLELAQSELGMRQAGRGQKELARIFGKMGGEPETAQPPKTLPSQFDEPVSVPPVAGATAQPTQPRQPSGPSGLRAITPEDIAKLSMMPGMGEKAKALSDAMKLEQDRYVISMNGIVFDKRNQQYLNLQIPGQKQEPFSLGDGKTYMMTPFEYSQYQAAKDAGQGSQWIQSNLGGRRSVAETEAETATLKQREQESQKRTDEAIAAGSGYAPRMAVYNSLESIAKGKDAKEIFGITQRPDFGSFVANLIQERLAVPGSSSSISAPQLVPALRNLGLDQTTINKYQFALSQMATIQLQMAKLAQGQGAVSNFERTLFADASISPNDNPETIIAKVGMLRARAEFERDLSKELRRTGITLDKYRMQYQDKYDDMENRYLTTAQNIVFRLTGQSTPTTVPSQYKGASTEVRRMLGM